VIVPVISVKEYGGIEFLTISHREVSTNVLGCIGVVVEKIRVE
jgi:hypothetical protein